MRLWKLLYNPLAQEPTVGLRGLLAFAIGLSSPVWIDGHTHLFWLAVVLAIGVVFGMQMLSQARRQYERFAGETETNAAGAAALTRALSDRAYARTRSE